MAFEILAFEGSTLTLLIIAIIAVIALAFFRFLIPLIIAGIIVVVLLILIFGGIPVPSFLLPTLLRSQSQPNGWTGVSLYRCIECTQPREVQSMLSRAYLKGSGVIS